jgi:hypothetical protein
MNHLGISGAHRFEEASDTLDYEQFGHCSVQRVAVIILWE